MKIDFVSFEWRPQADLWVCKIGFRLRTARQFCDEYQIVSVARRWWAVAYVAARWQAKFHARIHRAKPGEREAKGWA